MPRHWMLINERALECIDTPDKTYWFGLLWADGYVIVKGGKPRGLRLAIHPSDVSTLVALRAFLGSDAPITHGPNNRKYLIATLTIWSTQLAHDLYSKGLRARRSEQNAELPAFHPELMRHLLRGLFDGDGTLFRAQKSNFPLSGWVVSFAGSLPVVRLWQQFVCTKAIRWYYPDFQNGKNPRNRAVPISGPNALHALRFLYKNGDIAMASHARLAKLLIDTWHQWQDFGLRIERRGDGNRFVGTTAVPQAAIRQFIEKMKTLDSRATSKWGLI